jgi:cob(I)alamin adenosyltransferase
MEELLMDRGLIHIYEGDGKGKTTAAIGLCVRAVGAGKKLLFTQFLKDGTSHEIGILKKIEGIDVFSCETNPGFVFQMNGEEKLVAQNMYETYFGNIKEKLEQKCYDLLVLDEILDACITGMIREKDLEELLKNKSNQLEVVLTGHQCSARLEQMADYYSKIIKIRHPYDMGIAARDGIEK